MIKGCAKRVVVVRDIDSNFFEEAFFIVKQGSNTAKLGEGDFINEANRIVKHDLPSKNIYSGKTQTSISEFIPKAQKKSTSSARKSLVRDALMFVFGFGISAVICTAIYYSGIGV